MLLLLNFQIEATVQCLLLLAVKRPLRYHAKRGYLQEILGQLGPDRSRISFVVGADNSNFKRFLKELKNKVFKP